MDELGIEQRNLINMYIEEIGRDQKKIIKTLQAIRECVDPQEEGLIELINRTIRELEMMTEKNFLELDLTPDFGLEQLE